MSCLRLGTVEGEPAAIAPLSGRAGLRHWTTTVTASAANRIAATPAVTSTTRRRRPVDRDGVCEHGLFRREEFRVPGVYVDCMTDVILTYGDRDSVQRYLDGKIKMGDIKDLNTHQANAAGFKCTDLVTAPPDADGDRGLPRGRRPAEKMRP